MGLVSELRRRNVIRVAIAYAIAAWLLIEVSATTFPMLRLPEWTATFVTVLLLIGFPVALIIAWAFELTPEGLKKESDVDRSESTTHITGRKLDFAIIGVLAIALVFFASTHQWNSETDSAEIIDKSIAVLAFADLSPEGNQEYFSDGISEEILNLLAKVPELRVISRSSAFSFKGQNVDVPTMAARLNVAHVLEGSVRKSGDQMRITAQLIEGATDTHLWSETYDRELMDVFAIQDEIAVAVVEALKLTLLGEELKATETNPEVYALYLQGRHLNNQGTVESLGQAETLLKQTLETDPRFAPAWVELGSVYRRQASVLAIRPFDEGNDLARHAIQKALELDPEHGRAYAALAEVEMIYDWDFTAAFQHMQQALALNPGDVFIVWNAARLNFIVGRLDEAIELYRQSVALDPVSSRMHSALGGALYKAHRLEEAAESIQKALLLSSGRRGAISLVRVLLAQGDAPAALVAMEQVTSDFSRLWGMALVQHALGDAGASDAALRAFIENWAAGGAYQVAEVYAFRGEIDHAFDWLEHAYDNRDGGLAFMLLDPLLANLRDDSRWEPLLNKVGLPY